MLMGNGFGYPIFPALDDEEPPPFGTLPLGLSPAAICFFHISCDCLRLGFCPPLDASVFLGINICNSSSSWIIGSSIPNGSFGDGTIPGGVLGGSKSGYTAVLTFWFDKFPCQNLSV